MRYLMVFLVCMIVSCVSCGAATHIPEDIAANYSSLGYYNIEFDSLSQYNSGKWMGIVPVTLNHDSSMAYQSVSFYGIYNGTANIRSEGCSANYSIPFNWSTRLQLSNFMATPTDCVIYLNAVTNQINGFQHRIAEIGKIDVFVIKKGLSPVTISYNKSTPLGLRNYTTIGNSAVMIPSGSVTSSNVLNISSKSARGDYTVTSSCQHVKTSHGTYTSTTFPISLRAMYGFSEVKAERDGCNFNITLTPEDQPNAIVGRVSVSVYQNTAVPLEYPTVFRYISDKKPVIESSGGAHVIGTTINNTTSPLDKKYKNNKVTVPYLPTTPYTIRALTINGRKSVLVYQNGKVIWW